MKRLYEVKDKTSRWPTEVVSRRDHEEARRPAHSAPRSLSATALPKRLCTCRLSRRESYGDRERKRERKKGCLSAPWLAQWLFYLFYLFVPGASSLSCPWQSTARRVALWLFIFFFSRMGCREKRNGEERREERNGEVGRSGGREGMGERGDRKSVV